MHYDRNLDTRKWKFERQAHLPSVVVKNAEKRFNLMMKAYVYRRRLSVYCCTPHATEAKLSPRQRRIADKQRLWREQHQKRPSQEIKFNAADIELKHTMHERPTHGPMASLPFSHHQALFSELKVEDLLNELGTRLRYDNILLEGKEVQESRMTAWLSDVPSLPFLYSGKVMTGGPLTPIIKRVRDQLALNIDLHKIHYDSCLVNYYPHGKSGMRFHSDPLYEQWQDVTAVVSVGQSRKFIFRRVDDFAERHEFIVSNGDVTLMDLSCQERYQHSIAVEKGEGALALPPRISLVFKKRIG